MKQCFVFLALFLFVTELSAQDFAPIGAEWYYSEGFAFSGNIDYIKFTSEKDTLIKGEICRKISKRHKIGCNDRPYTEFVFTRNDTVFFHDAKLNKFQILYVFNAGVNDSWVIEIKDEEQDLDTIKISVDSISIININGIDLKVLYVTYFKLDENMHEVYSSKIIEKIGDIQYMFNWFPWSSIACDVNYTNGLRCYEDQNIGFYSTGIADSCTHSFIWTGIKNKDLHDELTVFPNPADDYLEISIESPQEVTIELIDLFGNSVYQKKINSHTLIDLSGLQKGFYILVVRSKEKILGYRRIIKL